MARQYPRFLYSDPTNTKSRGPFVLHMLEPKLICRIVGQQKEDTQVKNNIISSKGISIELLKVFEEIIEKDKVNSVMNDMINWISTQKLS